ncbi:LPS assembly lipoprotein LptE [Sinorhizobium numidicum]|uniref:LPS assembly lipoprotein LptE n=1 Tax=Sinorhizobium numidicum TaxID=680248 RepID=A0ABY8D4G8_9HYPH|nr:LPS assembly lipoprotein LptE [Sinorhizobium numidicum]WEX77397.1 LPS assembly lipoprotein LptE [Sinorhizobium numidicum]WEX84056.1 LPS assembly lipoprotein LptE [Sinorhizobium numidicum]
MSLSDKAGFRFRSLPMLAGALLLTALAGCQVRPLYSDGPTGATSTGLASIEISDADDRVEQEVRNALVFMTSRGQGEPVNPQYHLALNVSHRTMGVLYDQARDRAGAGRIVVKADYNLTKTATGETVESGNRSAVALVDFPAQEFAKVRAVRDGENRAAKELAEIISADIAAALGR